jgi:3-(3-hydroxy-phenyl)propionate hydroxylase
VYLHHSRIAETFQVGRVFLAGDAAHLQPPFFGQGMNSGIRDATNLAWKLAAVVSGRAGQGVLDSYDAERRHHAAEMVAFATRIGRMYSPRNRATERVRDLAFRALQLVPGGKDYVLQMKYKPMPRYATGVVVGAGGGDGPVGRMFMQPVVETIARRREKLDDAIGPWFAVIGIQVDPALHLGPASLAWWRSLGARFVRVDASRSGPRPTVAGDRTPFDESGSPTLVLEDVDGAFRDWLLARPGDEIIVLRPDRYLAAVCDRHRLESTTDALRCLLTDQGEHRRAG